MRILGSTTSKVQLITAAIGTIRHSASWVDDLTTGPTFTPDGITNAVVSTAATVDLVPVPAASTKRNIKSMNVSNTDAAVAQLIVIQQSDGSNTDTLWKGTLQINERVSYEDGIGWTYYGADGAPKVSAGSGQFIASTVLTSASANFTTGPNTHTIKIRGVAGGGGGGGCTSVAAAASAAGGGAAGGYAEKTFAVSPNTAYAYVCGALGAGASGALGGTGGDSTFIVGGTTVTCKGGPGAPVATAVTTLIAYRGGLPPAVSTSGDVNGGGDPGKLGIIYIAAGAGVSGEGGSGPFGGGGGSITAVGNGLAATGFGAGGGGALTGASAVRTGGSGTAGAWIVDEYT